jgi:hypothetical protein
MEFFSYWVGMFLNWLYSGVIESISGNKENAVMLVLINQTFIINGFHKLPAFGTNGVHYFKPASGLGYYHQHL